MVRGLLGRLFAGLGTTTVQGAGKGRFSVVSPGRVAPRLDPDTIPASVTPPLYYRTGRPAPAPPQPDIKASEQIMECERHVNHVAVRGGDGLHAGRGAAGQAGAGGGLQGGSARFHHTVH